MMRTLSASLLVVLVAIIGAGGAQALDADDLPSAVENAKTAADHEAIAAFYEGEAKEARAQAEQHRAMGSTYKKHQQHSMPAGKGVPSTLNKTMPPHCDQLTATYEAAAKEYEAMAAAHREEASAIK
jgi:hypothetical protein